MKNLLFNILNKKQFHVVFKKIIKRFEKDTSFESLRWAKLNTKFTTEELCKLIDPQLFDEALKDIKIIEAEAKSNISKLDISMGGASNYVLLYFLVRKINPSIIVETGVAGGWSSLFILRALRKNGEGKLFSSDFPYLRLKNPNKYIGYLAKSEINKNDWYLDIRGDELALAEIINKIREKNIDLFHYDSDKSYSGRNKALNTINSNVNEETIIIFDDIQNNLHFRNLIEKTKNDYFILEFQGKYLGIIGANYLLGNNMNKVKITNKL